MKKAHYLLIIVSLTATILTGCCKDKNKNTCKSESFSINPFVQRFGSFFCGGNDYEYTYIFRKKAEIDSLHSECSYYNVAFSIDETNFAYIAVGRLSYHQKDTMLSNLYVDTCSRLLTYDVEMIQRDTTKVSFYPLGATMSIFCSVENIPADYQVEVKYKYVPLPE
ncbi:MAG TPA: hypothetical protein PL084_13080 [Chitinophagales bacterium]|nr:hypothetical protein [Chitinophagales bacterium]HRP38392.1 hypothetical protein [Chitinophagales bacterium]